MNMYTTLIKAISPIDGELKIYQGPNVPGISFNDAQNYCEMNGLGYCKIDGLLIAEINYSEDSRDITDYETKNLN